VLLSTAVLPDFDLVDVTADVEREDEDLTVSFAFSSSADLSMIGNWNAIVILQDGDSFTGEQTFFDAFSMKKMTVTVL